VVSTFLLHVTKVEKEKWDKSTPELTTSQMPHLSTLALMIKFPTQRLWGPHWNPRVAPSFASLLLKEMEWASNVVTKDALPCDSWWNEGWRGGQL
jgi:hypothetical protein